MGDEFKMKTTDAGYINKNNQKNLGCAGVSDTHYNQKFYQMKCLNCEFENIAAQLDGIVHKHFDI